MTPQEMKGMAIKAGQVEYEKVIAQLKRAASQGIFREEFSPALSDAVIHLLRESGYMVHQLPSMSGSNGYTVVSFE